MPRAAAPRRRRQRRTVPNHLYEVDPQVQLALHADVELPANFPLASPPSSPRALPPFLVDGTVFSPLRPQELRNTGLDVNGPVMAALFKALRGPLYNTPGGDDIDNQSQGAALSDDRNEAGARTGVGDHGEGEGEGEVRDSEDDDATGGDAEDRDGDADDEGGGEEDEGDNGPIGEVDVEVRTDAHQQPPEPSDETPARNTIWPDLYYDPAADAGNGGSEESDPDWLPNNQPRPNATPSPPSSAAAASACSTTDEEDLAQQIRPWDQVDTSDDDLHFIGPLPPTVNETVEAMVGRASEY